MANGDGVTEKFNAEAAITAVKNASASIEDLIRNFEKSRKASLENLANDATASAAMGGQLGAAAQNAFLAGSNVDFDRLKQNLNIFVNNVESIVQNSSAMAQTASSIYSSQGN